MLLSLCYFFIFLFYFGAVWNGMRESNLQNFHFGDEISDISAQLFSCFVLEKISAETSFFRVNIYGS